MKPIMTLLMAVVMACSALAQAGAGAAAPLSHEDSLVLAELRADSTLRSSRSVQVLPFPVVINAVLKDIPFNMRNITGELVLAQGEFENYASVVELPGSQSCIVTRYHSADDTTCSWQAKMFTGDDFGQASKVYHELFRKLQGCHMVLVDGSIVYLTGDWEPAKEEAPFTTSTLRLQTGDWRYRDVKVELELVYQLADWAIHINIVTKKRDDEVGGGVITSL
ncbi:MAG: hypothetical protein JST68_06470 [Bacteroidetes bacterium]|nr:hypothetical protein [Bacteroidota bacterium]